MPQSERVIFGWAKIFFPVAFCRFCLEDIAENLRIAKKEVTVYFEKRVLNLDEDLVCIYAYMRMRLLWLTRTDLHHYDKSHSRTCCYRGSLGDILLVVLVTVGGME